MTAHTAPKFRSLIVAIAALAAGLLITATPALATDTQTAPASETAPVDDNEPRSECNYQAGSKYSPGRYHCTCSTTEDCNLMIAYVCNNGGFHGFDHDDNGAAQQGSCDVNPLDCNVCGEAVSDPLDVAEPPKP